MKLYKDEKITLWVRTTYNIGDEYTQEEAIQQCLDSVIGDDTDYLFETEEFLLPEENNNQATLEIVDSKTQKVIYSNADTNSNI